MASLTSLSTAFAGTSPGSNWPYEVVKNQAGSDVAYQVQTLSYFTAVAANNPLGNGQRGQFSLPTSTSKLKDHGNVVFTFPDNSQCTVQFSVDPVCVPHAACHYYPEAQVTSQAQSATYSCQTADHYATVVLAG